MKWKLVFVVFALMSCSSNNSTKEEIKYHSYAEVSDKTISWENCLNKSNHYYVYCYSLTCKYCEEIRNEVIHIALKNVKTIYFCYQNVNKQDLDPSQTIGTTDISHLFIRGFPSLVEVSNKTVINNIVGKTKVINELRS